MNEVFFAAAAFLPELFIFILYLSICFNLAREVTSEKMTTKFSYRELNKARSVSCALCFQGYLFESFRGLLCFYCPWLVTCGILSLFY